MIRALLKRLKGAGEGISIIVPYKNSSETNARALNWRWLRRYFETHLSKAEILLGTDDALPFSKSVAVNGAAAKASGDIFVIIDADAFLPAHTILECATRIREARAMKRKLWFIPYRNFHRLTEQATGRVLACRPEEIEHCPVPTDGSGMLPLPTRCGHWFGAGAHILPREAFEAIGGWDPRFRGWGSEDSSAMLATDTLYGKHKTINHSLFHLWHPMMDSQGKTEEHVDPSDRVWSGQTIPGPNSTLGKRYAAAHGDPVKMRQLVNEAKSPLAMARAAAATPAATTAKTGSSTPNSAASAKSVGPTPPPHGGQPPTAVGGSA